jgi:endo-1,4-beta-xylanase
MTHVRLVAFLACAGALSGQTLRDLAARRAIRVGAAVDPTYFPQAQYSNTLAAQFSQAQPENAMKFGPIQPGPATYSFTQGDQIVQFAQAHNMAVRGHTLVWYNQNPTWLTTGNYTPAQLSSILHDHIQTVVSHYAGQVYAWDVVNEAFSDSGGALRSTIWSDSPGIGLSGTAYIEQAFRWPTMPTRKRSCSTTTTRPRRSIPSRMQSMPWRRILWPAACRSTASACRCTSPLRASTPPASPPTSSA